MKLLKNEIADIIEKFLLKRDGKWDWDDFISIRLADIEMDQIRQICADLHEDFPPTKRGEYCNEEGLIILADLVKQIRGSTKEK